MKLLFMGEYQHTIDAKGRVSIPAKFRDALDAGFVITKGLDKCLFVFSMEQWEKVEEKLSHMSMTKKDSRAFVRQFLSGATEAEVDKNGRALIPQNLRTYASLDKDAVIIGAGSRVEIWDKAMWDEYMDNVSEDYENIAEELLEEGFDI